MLYISFNKGNNLQEIGPNADPNCTMNILNKLNEKTWNSVIKKMDDDVIVKISVANIDWNLTLEDVENMTTVELAEQYTERIQRYNILYSYSFELYKAKKQNTFVV